MTVSEGVIRRWNRERTAYVCADGVKVRVRSITPGMRLYSVDNHDEVTYVSTIAYNVNAGKAYTLVAVPGILFDRDMWLIVWAARGIKTITFPRTIKIVQESAFHHTPLMSAVLNEGLEELGECGARNCRGVFHWTKLKRVVLPSTLRVIGNRTFY